MNAGNSIPEPLPLVIQVGFAGARRLTDEPALPEADRRVFEAEIENLLAKRLWQLQNDLKVKEGRYFFCGISALAAGADMIFARACAENGMCHRIFLPQTRDEFLNAVGSEGPDFSPAQKEEAIRLLTSPQVIQERVVSDASKRDERFADTNREIVRISDVLVCLLRSGSEAKAGGTGDLIARAMQRGKPVLVIHVSEVDGKPLFAERWRCSDQDGNEGAEPARAFKLPKAPETLAGVELPLAAGQTMLQRYVDTVKTHSSRLATRMRTKFKTMVCWIIFTHLAATILAAVALAMPASHRWVIPWLLIPELIMLALGFWTHDRLEHTRAAHLWAEARLLAEVARSVIGIGNLHVYLNYLFLSPFPQAIRPVLRTINVLQLKFTRYDQTPWQEKRDLYVSRRLNLPDKGQIDFYHRRIADAGRHLGWAHGGFLMFWVMAFAATAFKLCLIFQEDRFPNAFAWAAAMGISAIVMPVLAVGMLSLAQSLDLEAQKHTYREMLEFLREQKRNLENAASERDFAKLVLETESRLLGETANWFSRRSFTAVA